MNIIVCYKWVLDAADLKVNADRSVDFSRARGKISEFDRNAIETAIRTSLPGEEIVALTYGSPAAQKSIKDVLSRGPTRACWVSDPAAEQADGWRTARVLAAAIQQTGNFKLILCAEGSEDSYAHEIGPRLGALLNLPVVTNAIELHLVGDRLQATRKLEHEVEIVEAPLPAVVSVLPEIYPAPIPGLKMVLEASKKPVAQLTLAELGIGAGEPARQGSVTSRLGFQSLRKQVLIKQGTDAEKVQSLVASLRKEGVLA